jgi:hypothetical protein
MGDRLFDIMENEMTKEYIAMTMSLPGTWVKSSSPTEALEEHDLHKSHYEKDAVVKVFEVHPDTWVDEMGTFHHPKGHPPVQVS